MQPQTHANNIKTTVYRLERSVAEHLLELPAKAKLRLVLFFYQLHTNKERRGLLFSTEQKRKEIENIRLKSNYRTFGEILEFRVLCTFNVSFKFEMNCQAVFVYEKIERFWCTCRCIHALNEN